MKRFTITEGYSLPIFNDGSVRFNVLDSEGTYKFSVAHYVRGITGEEQKADVADARERLQQFIDLANAGALAQ